MMLLKLTKERIIDVDKQESESEESSENDNIKLTNES